MKRQPRRSLPQMYSQTPVFAGAFQTDPDPVRHTDPLRVESPTLKAKLKHRRDMMIFFTDNQ